MKTTALKFLVCAVAIAALCAAGCGGSDGKDGVAGAAGKDGVAGGAGKDGTPGKAGVDGTAGTNGNDGTAGTNGSNGTNGTNGTNGSDGTNCTVTDNHNGTKTIACTDGSSVTVGDGTNGENGLGVGVTNFHGSDALLAAEFEEFQKFIAKAEITAATADAAGVVTVDFKVSDAADKPITYIPSVGANIVKLVAAGGGEATSKWVPYIWRTEEIKAAGDWPAAVGTKADQGYRETDGTFTNNGDGTYRYVFKTNIAAVTMPVTGTAIAYERNLTHRVSVMMGGHNGPTATATYDFVPDGVAAVTTRDIIKTSACKQCHGEEFKGHGGDRLTVENCVTCHTPGSTDANSGNTIDFKVMIHKIHAGGELFTIPGADGKVWDDPATTVNEAADNGTYVIWGYNNTKFTWWKVGFPAVIDNCTKCHDEANADGANFKTPSRTACGSCHDNVDFATGANHPGLAQADDSTCLVCHKTGGAALPVDEAHDWIKHDPRKIPEYIPELSVSTPANGKYFVAGERPIVTLKLRDAEAAGTPYILDHAILADDGVTSIPPGDGAEGCDVTGCPSKDGKFTNSSFFVHGPRARKVPVLSTMARVVAKSTLPGPFDISSTKFSFNFSLKVDGATDIRTTDISGGDKLLSGNLTIPVYATGGAGTVASTPAPTTTVFTDANQAFLGSARTWKDHAYAGYKIYFTDNTDTAKPTATGTVLDNVGAAVTLSGAVTMLTSGHVVTYSMYAPASGFSSIATGGTSTTLVDSTQAWTTDQYKGFTVSIIGGTGAAQTAAVTGNDATTLTVAAFATAPDATSTYMVSPFANVAQATSAEIVNWLNANAGFKARAIAYLDEAYISSATAAFATLATDAPIAIGDTTLRVAKGTGAGLPTTGSLTIDKDTLAAETLAFTARSSDTFTIAAATKVHSAKAAVIIAGGDAIAIGGAAFAVTAGNGAMFPATGSLVIDRTLNADGSLASTAETVAYTRSGDNFTITGGTATKAHTAKASVWAKVSNVVSIRSRNLGKIYSLQLPTSDVQGKVFPAETVWAYPIHVQGSDNPGATDQKGSVSTASNKMSKQVDATKNDPKVTWSAGSITYTLDPVDDLEAGTYISSIEFADRGALVTDVNYKTPTVARIKFQVKVEAEELPPAANCGTCHTSGEDDSAKQNIGREETEKGFILDFTRHHKVFNNTAPDRCGSCHDQMVQAGTGADWTGSRPISRRVHAVHFGSSLNYPLASVAYSNGDPIKGRNWDITLPQDVRNCQVCHPKDGPNATSGTWKTNPSRLPCMGCHDSDAASLHMRTMTFDPTPADPWSGDEVETCKSCHASE